MWNQNKWKIIRMIRNKSLEMLKIKLDSIFMGNIFDSECEMERNCESYGGDKNSREKEREYV